MMHNVIRLPRIRIGEKRKAEKEKREAKAKRMSKQAERDRLVVRMLAERMSMSSAEVAERHGVSAEWVRVAVSRVAHDDIPVAAAELRAGLPGLSEAKSLMRARRLFYPWSAQ